MSCFCSCWNIKIQNYKYNFFFMGKLRSAVFDLSFNTFRFLVFTVVPTTMQNSFSLIFPWLSKTKWIVFSWLICSRDIPMLAFNRLQLNWKQKRRNRLKSLDANTLRAKRTEKKFKLLYAVCVKQFKIVSAFLLTFAFWYFDFPWLSLTLLFFSDFRM